MHNKVLVTRPGSQGRELCEALERTGMACEHIPAMIISENPQNNLLASKLDSGSESEQELGFMRILKSAQLIIVISANAVNYCKLLHPEFTRSTPILAIGKSTQQALIQHKNYSEQQISMPKQYSTEGLLALELLQNIRNKKIALVCGVGGRKLLEQVLLERGAVCSRIESYQRTYPSDYEEKLQRYLTQNNFIDNMSRVVVTSGQALENLVKMAGGQLSALLQLQLVVISQRIANLAIDLGFEKPALIIENADNAAIVKLLKKG